MIRRPNALTLLAATLLTSVLSGAHYRYVWGRKALRRQRR